MTPKPIPISGRAGPVRHRLRRGATFHEATMAIAITATVLVGVTYLLIAVAQHRRTCQRQMLAVNEASNVMESLMVRSWSEVNGELTPPTLSPELVREIPDAHLQVRIVPEGDRANLRRIQVAISWPGASGEPIEPVRLVGWRLQPQENQP